MRVSTFKTFAVMPNCAHASSVPASISLRRTSVASLAWLGWRLSDSRCRGAWRPRLITCCQSRLRLTPGACHLPSGPRNLAVIHGNAFQPSLTAYLRRLVTDQQHHGIAKTAFRGPAKNVGGLPAPRVRVERANDPDRMQTRPAPVGARAAANPRPARLRRPCMRATWRCCIAGLALKLVVKGVAVSRRAARTSASGRLVPRWD